MRRRVLVTGGAGFIGSHICERLLDEGCEVMCLDNFFTGNKRNIVHLLDSPYFELIRHDIVNPILLEVDQVLNLACPASPVHYQHNPVKTVKTNVMGMINMLGLCKRVGCPILQASTSEVYGDPLVEMQSETYWGNVNPIGIRSCYDEGKRVAETLCMDYHRQNGVNVKIARIFNTYGPRMARNDGRVVSNFIVQALQNEDITLYGDGSQTRSFCFVEDTIEGLLRMFRLPPEQPGPVNIGNPSPSTIQELAELVVELCDSRSKLTFLPLPSDDPQQRCPDISKARELLDWNPTTTLRQGLLKTITYFDELLREDSAHALNPVIG